MKEKLEAIRALEAKNNEQKIQTEHKAKQRIQRSNDDALAIIEERENELKQYKEHLMNQVKIDLEIEQQRLEAQHLLDKEAVAQEFEAKRTRITQTMIEEVFKYGNR